MGKQQRIYDELNANKYPKHSLSKPRSLKLEAEESTQVEGWARRELADSASFDSVLSRC